MRGAGANLMSFHDAGTVLAVIDLGVMVVNCRFSGYLNIVSRIVLSFQDLRAADSSYIAGCTYLMDDHRREVLCRIFALL